MKYDYFVRRKDLRNVVYYKIANQSKTTKGKKEKFLKNDYTRIYIYEYEFKKKKKDDD